MPKLVERTARRREIADAVIRLVCTHGVEGVTVRSVAAEAGWSTGVLAHYFHDKDALVAAAFERIVERVTARVTAKHYTGSPLAALAQLLEEMLPLDATRGEEVLAWFSFAGYALGRPALVAIQQQAYAQWRTAVQAVLDAAHGDDRPHASADGSADQAAALVSFVDGLALQVLFDPEGFPPERQRALLTAAVSRLRPST